MGFVICCRGIWARRTNETFCYGDEIQVTESRIFGSDAKAGAIRCAALSLISLQAGTALHVFDRQPEHARAAVTTVREASLDALRDLRRVVTTSSRLSVVASNGTCTMAPSKG